MSYAEVILAIRGYENKQSRDWEKTRLVAYYTYCGIPKKETNKSIFQFMPLPSDMKNRPKQDAESMRLQREFFIKKELKRKENLN